MPTVNQTGTSGYITSPNYPNNYESADLREYYITAPSTSYTVRIFITLLALKKHIVKLTNKNISIFKKVIEFEQEDKVLIFC